MKRTNLSVDSQVFEKFSQVAKQQNKTIFAFANEALDFVHTVYSQGGDLRDLRRLWNAYQIIKTIDVITLPSDFMDDLNEKLVKTDKEWTVSAFNNLGKSVGALLRMSSDDVDSLAKMAEDFFILIPVKHFKLAMLDQNSIQVDIAGAGRKIESAECTAEFVKGVLEQYDYIAEKVELNIGTVRIKAIKKGAYSVP
ncbi:MAG: hypothetical protein QXV32_05600 [Conexivisphaerales archaeon]